MDDKAKKFSSSIIFLTELHTTPAIACRYIFLKIHEINVRVYLPEQQTMKEYHYQLQHQPQHGLQNPICSLLLQQNKYLKKLKKNKDMLEQLPFQSNLTEKYKSNTFLDLS